ncbi:MAG: uracil-DNA glycosylase [Acidimicrobiia bacterium]|nr:uracil-DNA glycosylase [Acidimicrobiia bacterium]
MSDERLEVLHAELIDCRKCPRLVEWREKVAQEKRASFKGDDYWGRPVPGMGDPEAQIVLVGLAPAAHGANRTGRMFTGDRSGEWLFRALHRAGLANQPTATSADDGLELRNAFVTSAVHCAPPDNKPTPEERNNCSSWLQGELDLLSRAQVYICLGGFGYTALWRHLGGEGVGLPKPRPKFGHGVEIELESFTIVCSYHPSQQNTFTGRLTEEMLDAVMKRAVQIAGR